VTCLIPDIPDSLGLAPMLCFDLFCSRIGLIIVCFDLVQLGWLAGSCLWLLPSFLLLPRCFGRMDEAYWIPDPKPHPDYETYVQMLLGSNMVLACCQASDLPNYVAFDMTVLTSCL